MKGHIIYQIVEGPHDPDKISMHPADWEVDSHRGALDERIHALLLPWLAGKDRSRAIKLVIYYTDCNTPPGKFARLPVTALPIPHGPMLSHGLN